MSNYVGITVYSIQKHITTLFIENETILIILKDNLWLHIVLWFYVLWNHASMIHL